MTDTPFTSNEEMALYASLGLPVSEQVVEHEATEEVEKEVEVEVEVEAEESDARPNPACTVVIQVPDISSVVFDPEVIEGLDITDPQQRAEASRRLFATYGAAAYGIPKGTHRSNWNSLIHTRISMFLGRQVAATRQEDEQTLRRKVKQASAEKVADTAAISTQAALKVLKEQVLDENGDVDLAKFAALLQQV